MREVWHVAAENDWIPRGKVGGVGDVIRDLPPALAATGCRVRVVVPAYGAFHHDPGARPLVTIEGQFAGEPFQAKAWRLAGSTQSLEQVVIDHPRLCPGQPGQIYHSDSPNRPFETDSSKFAFFCAAVAAWLNQEEAVPPIVHLHDWHTGFLPWLRACAPDDAPIRGCRMVFTIHNLAYQGLRPLAGTDASLAAWFPEYLDLADATLDPHDARLANPMAAAIRLADAVATVSPTYAEEIRQPNDPARGFHGGEGLESLLQRKAEAGRLVGILNGCEYPDLPEPRPWDDLLDAILNARGLLEGRPILQRHIESLRGERPGTVLLSIGRMVDQKVALFLEPTAACPTALDGLLDHVGDDDLFIMLGSGDPALEALFSTIGERRKNFLFLRGYAEALSELLYRGSDVFLMPSTFEPCGISQMLALRAGQPCVVHGVGGLKDTVKDGETGFVFSGASRRAQAEGLVNAVGRALALRRSDPLAWARMSEHARAQRFSWDRAARRTVEALYDPLLSQDDVGARHA
ncbi:MAG: glycogen/starch synthase [Pseudomonadota bacterium]